MPQSRYRLDQGSSKNDMLSMTLPYAPAKISIYCFSLKKKEYDIQYQVYKTIHALEAQQEKPMEKTSEELVPKEYHKFLKVFLKKESECMPLQKPWDCYSLGSSRLNSRTLKLLWESGVLGSAYVLPPC